MKNNTNAQNENINLKENSINIEDKIKLLESENLSLKNQFKYLF